MFIHSRPTRKPVLDEQPFVDKRCLEGWGLQPPLPYALHVTWQGCEYGVQVGWANKGRGVCAMFVCPVTGRLVERLYLWHGRLVSRHVLGLAYASQVRGKMVVWEFQSDRLRRSLYDPLHAFSLLDDVPVPRKPKRLPWPFYWHKVERLEILRQHIQKAFCANLARFY